MSYFIELLRKNVKRDGVEDLINYLLNESDYFIAPASTVYHLCEDGGFDSRAKDVGCLRDAFSKYPLVPLLHTADLLSCYLIEKNQ